MTEPRVVFEWDKNIRESIRCSLGQWCGHEVAHVRVWVRGPDGEEHPTRKGLTLRVEHLHELRAAVDALIAAASEPATGADGVPEGWEAGA